MKKRGRIFLTLIGIILFVGVAVLGVYELGDTVINFALNSYAVQLQKSVEQAQIESSTPWDTSVPASSVKAPESNAGFLVQQATTTDVKQSLSSMSAESLYQQANNQNPTIQQPTNSSNTDILITKDKLKQIEATVTPSDKMAVATLVLNRLSQSDIDQLIKFLEDGISKKEGEEIETIFYSRFTQEEIEKILKICMNYLK